MAVSTAKRIGRHLVNLRKAQGMTQQQVADRAELRGPTVSEVENGVYGGGLSIDTLERICRVLNVSLKEFFDSMPGI